MKDGAYVEANKLTVGQYLLERLSQWETEKKVSPRTAERYRELINDRSFRIWVAGNYKSSKQSISRIGTTLSLPKRAKTVRAASATEQSGTPTAFCRRA